MPVFQVKDDDNREAAEFYNALNQANLPVYAVGARNVVQDFRNGWSFARAFQPTVQWPPVLLPGGAPPTASPTMLPGTCGGCRGGLTGPCKRMADSTCWQYEINGICPVGTVECATEENTIVITIDLPGINFAFQEALRQDIIHVMCRHFNRVNATQECDIDVVIVSIGDAESEYERLARRSLSQTRVAFFVVEGWSVMAATSVLPALSQAETLAGVTFSNGRTVSAENGPTSEFVCESLPSRNCDQMQAACDVWCHGPSERNNSCNIQYQMQGAYPTGTIAHRCNCMFSRAKTVCLFQSTTWQIPWNLGAQPPVYIVSLGDVIKFVSDQSTGTQVVRFNSGTAFHSCNITDAQQILRTNGSLTYQVDVAEDTYFGHPQHCNVGLKVQVVVRGGSAFDTVAPSASMAPRMTSTSMTSMSNSQLTTTAYIENIGSSAEESSSTDAALVTGCVFAVLIFAAVLAIVIYRRRRRQDKNKSSEIIPVRAGITNNAYSTDNINLNPAMEIPSTDDMEPNTVFVPDANHTAIRLVSIRRDNPLTVELEDGPESTVDGSSH